MRKFWKRNHCDLTCFEDSSKRWFDAQDGLFVFYVSSLLFLHTLMVKFTATSCVVFFLVSIVSREQIRDHSQEKDFGRLKDYLKGCVTKIFKGTVHVISIPPKSGPLGHF